MIKKALLALASVSLVALTACQGRPDYGPPVDDDQIPQPVDVDDNQLPGQTGETDLDDDCLNDRSCVEPGAAIEANPPVALPPQHKIGDEIRGGVIQKPGVSDPEGEIAGPVVEATCDGDLFRHVGAEIPGIELHVLSIREAGEPGGEARVFVEREEAVALVLSSFEATRWHVQNGSGARITEIILNGNMDQSVDAPDYVSVTKLVGTQSFGEFATGGDDDKARQGTARLMQHAEEATGLQVRSFHGCDSGTAFVIGGR